MNFIVVLEVDLPFESRKKALITFMCLKTTCISRVFPVCSWVLVCIANVVVFFAGV